MSGSTGAAMNARMQREFIAMDGGRAARQRRRRDAGPDGNATGGLPVATGALRFGRRGRRGRAHAAGLAAATTVNASAPAGFTAAAAGGARRRRYRLLFPAAPAPWPGAAP